MQICEPQMREGEICLTSQMEWGCVKVAGAQPGRARVKHNSSSEIEAESERRTYVETLNVRSSQP
jgi:hypothetical protein